MVWLTGSKGMLGVSVRASFEKNGIAFIASDREVDIRSRDQVISFIGNRPLEWIVNCAGYTAVDRAEGEEELARSINGDGPAVLAGIAAERGAALIHISTDYVFDGMKDGAYEEDDAPNPISAYGRSKLAGEEAVRRGLERHFILRTAWLYGMREPNFVLTMIRLFRERDEVRVVNDQWGSPTSALDLAEAIISIILKKFDRYGIYHFSNEGRVTWFEFACAIYSIAKTHKLVDKDVRIVPIATSDYPTPAARPRNSYLSKEKIRREFGIHPRPWREALDDFIRSMQLAEDER